MFSEYNYRIEEDTDMLLRIHVHASTESCSFKFSIPIDCSMIGRFLGNTITNYNC